MQTKGLSKRKRSKWNSFWLDGKRYTIKELSHKFDISLDALKSRVKRNPGTHIGELLYTSGSRVRQGIQYEHNGVSKTCEEWSRVYPHLTANRIRQRFKQGVSLDAPLVRKDKAIPDPNWDAELPFFDIDLQLKTTIESYRKKGWSDDDIVVKIKGSTQA